MAMEMEIQGECNIQTSPDLLPQGGSSNMEMANGSLDLETGPWKSYGSYPKVGIPNSRIIGGSWRVEGGGWMVDPWRQV